MVYFTSDQHFGHRGIIEMQKRPFQSVEEMNAKILSNYNQKVRNNDAVYILGDICHRMRVSDANAIISKMNGKKHLLIGNHDKKYDTALFESICDFRLISLNGVAVALMHYPILSWPYKNRNSIHLHGHVHGRSTDNEKNRKNGVLRYDVGVDANEFFPVSIEQILDFYRNC